MNDPRAGITRESLIRRLRDEANMTEDQADAYIRQELGLMEPSLEPDPVTAPIGELLETLPSQPSKGEQWVRSMGDAPFTTPEMRRVLGMKKPPVTEFEESVNMDRKSGLFSPLKMIDAFIPTGTVSRKMPWQEYMFGTGTNSPFIRHGLVSLNTPISFMKAIVDTVQPLIDIGKLGTSGGFVGDMPVSPFEGGPRVAQAQAEMTEERLENFLPKLNKRLTEAGYDPVDKATYQELMAEEYPAISGFAAMAEELAHINQVGFPQDATPQDLQKEYPILADIGKYLSRYKIGTQYGREQLKLAVRDDPGALFADVMSTALGSLGVPVALAKVLKRIPGFKKSQWGNRALEGMGSLREGKLRYLDPGQAPFLAGKEALDIMGRKYANILANVSRTPYAGAKRMLFDYTWDMENIMKGRTSDPFAMLHVYYDAAADLSSQMKQDYNRMINEKIGPLIRNEWGTYKNFEDSFQRIENLADTIAEKNGFQIEEQPTQGSQIWEPFETVEPGQQQHTIKNYNADTFDSTVRSHTDDIKKTTEAVLDEVQQLKLKKIRDGDVDSAGNPIYTFKDLDDLRSHLRMSYGDMLFPNGLSIKDNRYKPVLKVYNDLYKGIGEIIDRKIVEEHHKIRPGTKAPSYIAELKKPWAVMYKYLENLDRMFKIDPDRPLEFWYDDELEAAWDNHFKILNENTPFRDKLAKSFRERTGVDLEGELAAWTYSKMGSGTPGIAAARIADSPDAYLFGLITTTPEFAGKRLRKAGIRRKVAKNFLDYTGIIDTYKKTLSVRPVQRALQIAGDATPGGQYEQGESVITKEARESLKKTIDATKGLPSYTGPRN